MKNKINLVDKISSFEKDGDIFFTTYNFQRKFFEEYLFSKFEDKTIPLILVDYKKYQENVLEYGNSKLVETKYFLESIKSDKIFHPKMALEINDEALRCIIGSNNLTRQAYTENAEITFEIKLNLHDPDDNNLVLDIKNFLENLLPLIKSEPHRDKLKDFIQKFPIEKGNENERESWIIHNFNESIYSLLLSKINGKIKEIYVVAPFFSSNKNFYNNLLPEFNKINFVVQQEKTDLPTKILKGIDNFEFYELKTDDDRYVHAKLIYIITDENNYLFGGSANFTVPAFLEKSNIELGILTKTNITFDNIINEIGDINIIDINDIISIEESKKDSKNKNSEFRLFESSFKGDELIVIPSNIEDIKKLKLFVNDDLKKYDYKIIENKIIFKIPDQDRNLFKNTAAISIQNEKNGNIEKSDYRLIHNPKYFPQNLNDLNYLDFKDANWLFNILNELSKRKNLSNYSTVFDELAKNSIFSKEDKEKAILKIKNKIESLEPKEKNIKISDIIDKIIKKKQRQIKKVIKNKSTEKDFKVINTFILLNKLILYTVTQGYKNINGLAEIRFNIDRFFNKEKNYFDILLSKNKSEIIIKSDLVYHLAIIIFIISYLQNKNVKRKVITKNEKKVFDKTSVKSLLRIKNKLNTKFEIYKLKDFLDEYKEILPILEDKTPDDIKKELSKMKMKYKDMTWTNDSYY